MFASMGLRPHALSSRLGITTLLMLLMLAGSDLGQAQTEEVTEPADTGPETLARTQILTRPTGAFVFLEGEYGLAGRAPYTVTYFLRGTYEIKTKLRGYEDWSADYFFSGKGTEKISIKLSPKTRLKALMRSAVIPGMGQAYSDQRVKGVIISAMQFSSLGAFLIEELRYRDSVDDFNAALTAFQNDANQRARLEAAQARLDRRYETRQRWAIITASIYIYNLIDVIAFFPSYHRNGLDVSLTVGPPTDFTDQTAQVGVRAQF